MRLFAAVLALCWGQAAAAQELRDLTTDRPDKTESPITVDKGRVQIELDFATVTTDRADGVRVDTVNVAPFNLKLGLSDATDVQLIVDSYIRQRETDRVAGTRRTIDGVGDVTLRLKHNLWGNDGGATAFALMPFVKLPTASNGFGNGAVEGGLIAPLSIRLSDDVDLGLMTEIDLLRTEDDRTYVASFVNSATLGHDLTDRVGVYAELFTERSTARDARWNVTFDTGVTLALGENAQLDTGINLGLTRAADDANWFVGFSRRF